MSSTATAQKQRVLRSAVLISAGTTLSRILGFLRDSVLLALFPRAVSEAFIVAFRLPNLFRRVLGEGALTVSFIPVYTDLQQNESEASARQLADAVYSLLSLVTLTLSALGVVLARPLFEFWVGGESGFSLVPGKLELAVAMARVMIFYIFLVSSYAFFMGQAQAYGRFFWAAFAPALFNLTLILVSFLVPHQGTHLAWGVLGGGVIQAGMVFYQLWQMGIAPRWTWRIRAPGIFRVLKNFSPGLLGVGVFQLIVLVNTFLAARMEEGTTSYFFAADRILEFPQSLIAVSLSSALLPELSRFWNRGEPQHFHNLMQESLKWTLVLALPAALGLWLLSPLIVRVLFFRGNFSVVDALATSEILKIHSFLLLSSCLSRVISQALYASQSSMWPAGLAAVVFGLHTGLAVVMTDRFQSIGLAWATALTGALYLFGLAFAYYHRVGTWPFCFFGSFLMRLTPALFGLAGILLWLAPKFSDATKWMQGVGLISLIILGVLIYGGLAVVFKNNEAQVLLKKIQSLRISGQL